MLGTQEHYDLLDQFEKGLRGMNVHLTYGRLDREAKEFWAKGRVYQNGQVNDLYHAFIHGYALGKVQQ